MLVALGFLVSEQSKGTEATAQKFTQLLDYCTTHPDAIIRYHQSDIILAVDSDTSYLSEPKACSRVGGYHYLSNLPKNIPPKPDDPMPTMNGAILVVSNILKHVMSSAAKSELSGLFFNGKEATTIRETLLTLLHPQPPTLINTDNNTAAGIANDTIKQRRSKAVDMRFYWISERVRQGHFCIQWHKSDNNRADYFTKHHPKVHHQLKRFQNLQHPLQTRKPQQLSPTTFPRSKPLQKPLQPFSANTQQQPKRPIVKLP